VASDGGIFAFGDGSFFGSAADPGAPAAVAISTAPGGRGYRVARSDGSVTTFGTPPLPGTASIAVRRAPIVSLAP